MVATVKIEVELPVALASNLRARIASGRFANESEAVAAALEASEDDERDLEAWIRGPLCEAYDAVENGSAVLLTSEEVRARLARTR